MKQGTSTSDSIEVSDQKNELVVTPPDVFTFKGPFDATSIIFIQISNPTLKHVAYKVKTTAPKRFNVRPNIGLISPGQEVSVAVMLLPLNEDVSVVGKSKFMIQYLYVSQDDIQAGKTADELWKNILPDDKNIHITKKIKVAFVEDEDKSNVSCKSSVQDKTLECRSASSIPAASSQTSDDMDAIRVENSMLKNENEKLKSDIRRLQAGQDTQAPSMENFGVFQKLSLLASRQMTLRQLVVDPTMAHLVAVLILLIGVFLGVLLF